MFGLAPRHNVPAMKNSSLLFALLLSIAASLFAQAPDLRTPKMMTQEERTQFLHDLLRDIPTWRTQVNAYRGSLSTEPRFRFDNAVALALSQLNNELDQVENDAKNLQDDESLLKDVRLQTELLLLADDLNGFSAGLVPDNNEYCSPTFLHDNRQWYQNARTVWGGIENAARQFVPHTLAVARKADDALAHLHP